MINNDNIGSNISNSYDDNEDDNINNNINSNNSDYNSKLAMHFLPLLFIYYLNFRISDMFKFTNI